MNQYLIKLSGMKDFFSEELLSKEEIVLLPLFPFTVRGEEVYNFVVTKRSNINLLKNYKPSTLDVEKLRKRNEDLILLLKDEYSIKSAELKSNLRSINQYKKVNQYFVEELLTLEERSIYEGSIDTVSTLKAELSRLNSVITKLERSISYNYLERSLDVDVIDIYKDLVEVSTDSDIVINE